MSLVAGLLVVDDVPFVGVDRKVGRGRLVVFPTFAGDVTAAPDHHSVGFAGGIPCDDLGRPLREMPGRESGLFRGGHGPGEAVRVDLFLCMHPTGREFADHHELVTAYVALLGGPAQRIDPTAHARMRRSSPIQADAGPFAYWDTASARAGLTDLNGRLAGGSVGIVGLGGTGSYVLDLVAKTPVGRIHLFDADLFLQHNAFRAPGAASIGDLAAKRFKVDHFARVYSNMHRGIVPHRVALGPSNLRLLDHVGFVFLCVDDDATRDVLVAEMGRRELPFVDAGTGLFRTDGGVDGLVRCTTGDAAGRGVGTSTRADATDGAAYRENIQIADLNALGAALAVVRWKRLKGFYADRTGELQAVFMVGADRILHRDRA